MAPRPGLTESLIVETAITLVDQRGRENLSLAALAKKLRVRSPSLYNHIDGLEGLYKAMILRGLNELKADLQEATIGRSGYEALEALANAYRVFAKRHPGLYPLTFRSTEDQGSALQAAGQATLNVILAVLRAYDLSDEAALHATRCLRSALHGFVALETGGGFKMPLDLDQSFTHLIKILDQGLRDTLQDTVNRDQAIPK